LRSCVQPIAERRSLDEVLTIVSHQPRVSEEVTGVTGRCFVCAV